MAVAVDDYTDQRAFASNVAFIVGEASVQLDVVPIRRSGSKQEAALKSVCPGDHDAPTTVQQMYVCADGHQHYPSQLLKARAMEDGTLVLIDKDEAAEIRTGGFPKNQMELSVHPAEEVRAACRPDELGYRIRPGRKAPPIARKLYSTLLVLAATPGVALVGELRLRDSRRMYQLEVWNGQLVLQSLIHPDDLADVDQIALPEFDSKQVKALQERAQALVESFDPERFRFDAKAALDKAAEQMSKDGQVMPAPAPSAGRVDDVDVLALLDATVKQVKESKRSKTTTPKKSAAKKTTKAA